MYDFSKIKALLGKGTKGKYHATFTVEDDNPVIYTEIKDAEKGANVLFEADWGTEHDAALIVELRNNIEGIMAYVEELEKDFEKTDKRLDKIVTQGFVGSDD